TNFASPALQERLAGWDFQTVVCPLTEFILAGGAAKCLVLQLTHPGARRPAAAPRRASAVRERMVEIQGDLLDTGLMNTLLGRITEGGGSFEIEAFQAGLRHDQASLARLRVVAPSPERLETILTRLVQMGARVAEEDHDARLEAVTQPGVARIAWEMRRVRDRGGKIVVVGGPVVIHTGGGPHLARLVRRGYVQALLAGNGLAAHDIEQALFGTSLGVDLKRGINVQGGHRNHLYAINLVRESGGIRQAVERGILREGVLYECVANRVPFVLAGSIRDDGPLPETIMDLLAAQEAYARAIE